MTSISASFTAEGASATIYVKPRSTMTFSISGTYVGKLVLQKAAGGAGWLTVRAFASAETVSSQIETDQEAVTFRWACTSYTSGTITYTLADSTSEVLQQWVNADGAVVFKIDESGVTNNGTSSGFTTTPSSASITLAMMADLAVDKIIGRATAGTGVPEAIACTAAARSVLDDATVSAMVDTLGGASATGSGGLARATSPTFVTPLLGTPTSGVLTNCTGTAAGLTAGAATLAADSTKIANTTPSAKGLAAIAAADAAALRVEALGAQPASSAQAAVATDAAGLAAYGFTEAQANGIVTLLNRIRADLVTAGIIKGSA